MGFATRHAPNFTSNSLDNLQVNLLSTLHAVTSALHSWTVSVDAGHSVATLFVDFHKAFDLVDQNILLKKITAEMRS